MQENIDQNSWKYKIAEQIVSSYKTDTMSKHIFENVIIKELLWHATTMIKGYKVNRNGEIDLEKEEMVQIKYIGQRYWSKKAIEKYKDDNPQGTNRWKTVTTGTLTHEHAVPRNMIREKILKILASTAADSDEENKIGKVYEIIRKYSKAIIITQQEDKDFPKQNKNNFTKWETIDKEFGEVFQEEGEDFIDFIKKERYSKNIEIVDLCKHLDKNDIMPYDEKFKDIMHKI
jgi:hypothetical protein